MADRETMGTETADGVAAHHETADLRRRVERVESLLGDVSLHVGHIRPELDALGGSQKAGFIEAHGLLRGAIARLDTLNSQVWSLRDDLPQILEQALASSRRTPDQG